MLTNTIGLPRHETITCIPDGGVRKHEFFQRQLELGKDIVASRPNVGLELLATIHCFIIRPGLLLSLSLSLVQAQVSIVNGVSVYQGTTVSQIQHGIPTLAYNCAKVPASCENVHQQYPLATTVHAAPAGAVTGHHTILGARSHLPLHFDRNDNIGGQRGKACAKNWKNHHNCPESSQPE
ncbi:hypothetical protein FOXYSP1_00011 [Fusarium oxysporum f. sp. phaseoli]